MGDNTDIVPGSINDNVLQAIADLQQEASLSKIGALVYCNSDVLLIALGALTRDGFIRKTNSGYYEMCDQIKSQYHANPHKITGSTSMGNAEKKCNGCGRMKPLNEYYTGAAKCKRCVLDRQRELKSVKGSEAATSKGKKRATPKKSQRSPFSDLLKHAATDGVTYSLAPKGLVTVKFNDDESRRLVLSQDDSVVILDVDQVTELHSLMGRAAQ